MAYTTQANVEAYLKRELTTDEENLFANQLKSVENWINNQIGGSFGDVSETTRYYDGSGESILSIDPVMSVTSVKLVDSEELEVEEYEMGIDYELRPRNESVFTWIDFGRIGCTPWGIANISVTGKFTLGEVPDDIEYLATYIMAQLFTRQDNVSSGDLKSETIEGYSRTFNTIKEYSQDSVVQSILEKYTKDEVLF
jgi:hypothetical protein